MTVPEPKNLGAPYRGERPWMVFAGQDCYSAGGVGDLIGWADTVDDAVQLAKMGRHDWAHAFNVETGQVSALLEPTGTPNVSGMGDGTVAFEEWARTLLKWPEPDE